MAETVDVEVAKQYFRLSQDWLADENHWLRNNELEIC